MNFSAKLLLAVLLTAILALAALLYVASSGIPFLEGDRITTEGEAEGFAIGMSKAQAFDSLKINYRNRGANVRIPESDAHGEYLAPMDSLTELPPPLSLAHRWDVRLPASWVHTVYLTFEADRLVEIRHSRWLFERP